MRIGVDARSLSRPITGIGRYTLETCKVLSRMKGVSLYLYSPSSIADDIVFEMGSIIVRSHSWSNGLLVQIWAETYLPIWAKSDRVDVFWGPSHRLPRFLSSRIPRVLTIHDLTWKYARKTMRLATYLLERFQMPSAIRKADLLVSDSFSTREAIISEFDLEAQDIFIVYLAPSDIKKNTSVISLEGLNIDRPFFLFVGTLEPRKNLYRLLKAYGNLSSSEKSDVMLVIAGGGGWGGVDLEQMILKMGLKNNVAVLGYVDNDTLAELYSNAQFLIMPSLYEGFGLPIIESMSYGTPVIAANNSSMPEIVGNAGLLVDALSVDSISDGIRKMISNESLRKCLSENAKKNAAQFSWDKSAEGLFLVFKKAILLRNGKIL